MSVLEANKKPEPKPVEPVVEREVTDDISDVQFRRLSHRTSPGNMSFLIKQISDISFSNLKSSKILFTAPQFFQHEAMCSLHSVQEKRKNTWV